MKKTLITHFGYLKRQSVRQARRVEDYVQLEFADGSILSIFNVSSVQPPGASLQNAKLEGVAEEGAAVKFTFDNRSTLTVGMADSEFRGPEAMELIRSDGQRIVWP